MSHQQQQPFHPARPFLPNRPPPPSFSAGTESPPIIHYASLSQSSKSGQVVFRIWTKSSTSPLVYTPDDIPRSGFSAPARAFRKLSPIAYATMTHGMQDTDWVSGPILRRQLVNHVLGNVPSLAGRARGEEGVFISATRCLDWALWSVARRLAEMARMRAERLVRTDIAIEDGDGDGEGEGEEDEVHMTVIRLDSPGAVGVDGQKAEVWVQPRGAIQAAIDSHNSLHSHNSQHAQSTQNTHNAPKQNQGTFNMDKEQSYRARSMASESNEVLFFGRVFGSSVMADLVFTAETLSLFLPSKFFKPLQHPGNDAPGWLTRLRWDPKTDDWPAALRLIKEGNYTLPTFWRLQPFAPIPSFWPSSVTVASRPPTLRRVNDGGGRENGYAPQPQRQGWQPDPSQRHLHGGNQQFGHPALGLQSMGYQRQSARQYQHQHQHPQRPPHIPRNPQPSCPPNRPRYTNIHHRPPTIVNRPPSRYPTHTRTFPPPAAYDPHVIPPHLRQGMPPTSMSARPPVPSYVGTIATPAPRYRQDQYVHENRYEPVAEVEYDFMGPEAYERHSLAQNEAMLINLGRMNLE